MGLEHTKIELFEGIASVKDKLVMLIYIYHVVVKGKVEGRRGLYQMIQETYPGQLLEGETEANVEEVMIDIFENEFLFDHDGLRHEF
jgi:hypothetical protein